MKPRRRHIWKELPFIRIIPAFSAGYLSSEYSFANQKVIAFCILLSVLILIFFKFRPAAFAWKYNAWRGLSIQLLIFSLPAILLMFDQHSNGYNPAVLKHQNHFLLKISEPVTVKTNSYTATAKIYTIKNGKPKPASGSALITFTKKDQERPIINVGSYLITAAHATAIFNSKNPGGFDYRSYLSEKGIHYQFFLKKNDWTVLDSIQGNLIMAEIYKLRDAILDILRKNIRDSSACGLAEALLVGYRNDVESSLIQAYSNTGVVHVIAISGLHLGLIYIILMKLTSVFIRNKSRKIIQPLVVISALWIFTLLSGASASVVRSAVMFTVLATGNILEKKSNAINTLASSAFILLCYHPHWLKDIGFQLSYSAVASILLFHKKTLNSYVFTNPLAFKLWEMIALTLAAQLLTAPLLLYYFHQFPILFLFTNLIAVPLSSLILILELLLCALSPFNMIAAEIGNGVAFLIGLMNDYVLLMDRIPHSTIQSVNLSLAQTILIYLLIFAFSFQLIKDRWWRTISFLSIFGFLFSIRTFVLWESYQQEKLIILNTREVAGFGWITGIKGRYYQTVRSGENDNRLAKILHEAGIFYHIKSWVRVPLDESGKLQFSLHGFRLLHLNGSGGHELPAPILADMVLLSGNYRGKLTEIAAQTRCRLVVADATNSLWKIQEWKKQAEQLHLRFHSIPEQGAFLLDRSQFNPPEAVFADLNQSAR